MKRSEVKIEVTLGQVSNAPLISAWDEFCKRYGWNPYCLNEGFDRNNKQTISLEEAERWGIIDE
jgi:hypothetical protein